MAPRPLPRTRPGLTTTSDGTTTQSRDTNVYTLVQDGSAWTVRPTTSPRSPHHSAWSTGTARVTPVDQNTSHNWCAVLPRSKLHERDGYLDRPTANHQWCARRRLATWVGIGGVTSRPDRKRHPGRLAGGCLEHRGTKPWIETLPRRRSRFRSSSNRATRSPCRSTSKHQPATCGRSRSKEQHDPARRTRRPCATHRPNRRLTGSKKHPRSERHTAPGRLRVDCLQQRLGHPGRQHSRSEPGWRKTDQRDRRQRSSAGGTVRRLVATVQLHRRRTQTQQPRPGQAGRVSPLPYQVVPVVPFD